MLKAKITMPDFASMLPTREQVIALGVATVNVVLDQVEKDYAATYATFTHKPVFVKEKAKLVGTVVIGAEWTVDENYARLNDGTRRHQVGLGRQLMAYHPRYQRKTVPGHIGSGRGGPLVGTGPRGAHGGKLIARGPWWVSGIEPGRFDEVISWKAQRQLDVAAKKLATLLR
jgi:hypothetical protein